MPVASVENLGRFMGAYEITTPSGKKVVISPDEEARIAREALEWKLRQSLVEKERLKVRAIDATISAIGNAVGVTAGGWLLGKLLGKGL